jgi:hypothetical protein
LEKDYAIIIIFNYDVGFADALKNKRYRPIIFLHAVMALAERHDFFPRGKVLLFIFSKPNFAHDASSCLSFLSVISPSPSPAFFPYFLLTDPC